MSVASSAAVDIANNKNTEFVNKLHHADFLSPAKIFQNKHAVHQFENVTPDISIPGTPSLVPKDEDNHPEYTLSLPQTSIDTPSSLSPEHSGDETLSSNVNNDSSSASVTAPSRPTTPSQFIFKKPEYNKQYHHTHFHHHHHSEKKDTLFKDIKKLFKSSDKKKKAAASRSSTTSVYSDHSFANEFNKDLEGKYGKWGMLQISVYL